MSNALSAALYDRIYSIIEQDAETGGHLCIDELTDAIAELFDGATVALVGNLSEGFSVPMIYANFDDAAECQEGMECWIMTLDGENEGPVADG